LLRNPNRWEERVYTNKGKRILYVYDVWRTATDLEKSEKIESSEEKPATH